MGVDQSLQCVIYQPSEPNHFNERTKSELQIMRIRVMLQPSQDENSLDEIQQSPHKLPDTVSIKIEFSNMFDGEILSER